MTRVLLAVLLLVAASCGSPAPRTPAWLKERARQEADLAARSAVMHDFQFTDRRDASGITFQNRVVDDAAKDYKLVHYDHGNGVCAADVDGDGLPDLYFVTQLGTSELWKNLGGGRFVDITDQAGLRMPDAIAVGCAFADIDNDGDPDLFVTTVRHGNRLFENDGHGKFKDITAQAGVGYVGHSSGAVFFDYDGDGLVDLLVTNVGVFTTNAVGPGGYYVGLSDALLGHLHPERFEANILYHNLGGNRFKDVTREVALVGPSWSGDATAFDVNGDGFPDLYILDMQGGSHLWLNEGGKRFRDATAAYFPKTPWGAMGVKAFDFDGDGRLDLFVTSMHPDMWVNLPPGDWAAETRKDDTSQVSAMLFPHGKSGFLFGNELFADRGGGGGGGGGFAELSDSLGVETRRGGARQVWFRLDCAGTDRDHPLCAACAGPGADTAVCHFSAARRLTVMAARSSRSAVALDLDGDGDLDIVTNEFNAEPQVLVSDLAQRHPVHFLEIRLRGTRSNREGLGALVTVVLPGGRHIMKALDGKSGYLSQSDLPLYFGLADADHAASVEVRWPSGRRHTVPGPVKAGQMIEVVEP